MKNGSAPLGESVGGYVGKGRIGVGGLRGNVIVGVSGGMARLQKLEWWVWPGMPDVVKETLEAEVGSRVGSMLLFSYFSFSLVNYLNFACWQI